MKSLSFFGHQGKGLFYAVSVITVILGLAGEVWSQDDFPSGIFIPVGGGGSGASEGQSGTGSFRTAWGAKAGWKVTIRYRLKERSNGDFHSWVEAHGSDIKYYTDESNPWSRWYHRNGEYCYDCLVSFVAWWDNPGFWYRYNNSGSGADVDLDVVSIEPPAPPPPLISPEVKRSCGNYVYAAGVCAAGMGIASKFFKSSSPGAASVLEGIGLLCTVASVHYGKCASDPFDPDFESFYEPTIDSGLATAMKDICHDVRWSGDPNDGWLDEICQNFATAVKGTESHLHAVGVTNDRMESCILVDSSCANTQRAYGVDLFHAAADWSDFLARAQEQIALHLKYRGLDMVDPNTGWTMSSVLDYWNSWLRDSAWWFRNVQ